MIDLFLHTCHLLRFQFSAFFPKFPSSSLAIASIRLFVIVTVIAVSSDRRFGLVDVPQGLEGNTAVGINGESRSLSSPSVGLLSYTFLKFDRW